MAEPGPLQECGNSSKSRDVFPLNTYSRTIEYEGNLAEPGPL
jgi:hypothetical protein